MIKYKELKPKTYWRHSEYGLVIIKENAIPYNKQIRVYTTKNIKKIAPLDYSLSDFYFFPYFILKNSEILVNIKDLNYPSDEDIYKVNEKFRKEKEKKILKKIKTLWNKSNFVKLNKHLRY